MKNLIARIMPKKNDTTERYDQAETSDSYRENKEVLPHESVRYVDTWLTSRVNM